MSTTCSLATAWRIACAALALAACHPSAPAGYRIYVSNEADGTVSVIDGATRAAIATIPVGKRPRGLHVSRDHRFLYIALSGSPRGGPGVDESKLPPPDRAADGIGVVDLRTLRLVRTIASGQDPESFDVVDAHTLVVSNEDAALASIVDLDAGSVRARVPVGREPEGVTVAPTGDLVYVTSEADARVTAIDPRTGAIVATIPTGLRPRGIAFTRDGALGFVTDESDRSVTEIDALARTARGRIQLPAEGSSAIGPRPMGVALARDDRHAFVSTGRGGSVAVIDVGTGAVARVIPNVGARPWGIAVAPDGLVFTANGSSNDVSAIDPESGRVVARIPAGGSPWGVAID